MCRNIQTLFNFEPSATEAEVRTAAEVAHASMHLLADLVTNAPPKDREVEAAGRRARAEKRFATA
jgi:hypothetical protein